VVGDRAGVREDATGADLAGHRVLLALGPLGGEFDLALRLPLLKGGVGGDASRLLRLRVQRVIAFREEVAGLHGSRLLVVVDHSFTSSYAVCQHSPAREFLVHFRQMKVT
jgi:hypothetical protein